MNINTNNSVDDVKKRNPGEIIGLPPGIRNDPNQKNELYGVASMPVCRIYPAVPSTANTDSRGLHIYSLDFSRGIAEWDRILKTTKITNIKAPSYLDVAYLNETSISETFQNDYGDSKFEEFGNMTSGIMSELRQITGKQTGKESIQELSAKFKDIPMIGDLLGAAGNITGSTVGVVEDLLRNSGLGLGNLLSGSRVDFPAIWKNSSMMSSYSLTCKLYNPIPGNKSMYEQHILAPLAKLLAFVVPRSDPEAITYFTPLLCKVRCAGLWEIRAGYISSIEVLKGGEANDISFRQQPGTIDLRISFGELYNVVTTNAGDDKNNYSDRPTLGRYIDVLTKTALDENVQFYADLDDPYGNTRSNSFGTNPRIQKATTSGDTIPGIPEPIGRIAQSVKDVVKDILEKDENNTRVSMLERVVEGTKTKAKEWSGKIGDVLGDSVIAKSIKGIVELSRSGSQGLETILVNMVSGAKNSSLLGKIRDEVDATAAYTFSNDAVRFLYVSLASGGVNTLGEYVLKSKNLEDGVVYDNIEKTGNSMQEINMSSERFSGNVLANLLIMKRGSYISNNLKAGRIGKNGEVSEDVVKNSVLNNTIIFNNLNIISQHDKNSNPKLAELVDALVRIITGFLPKKTSNPGRFIGLEQGPINDISYEDVFDSSQGIIKYTIPEIHVVTYSTFSDSMKKCINTIYGNYYSKLFTLINAKRDSSNEPSDETLIQELYSAKSDYLNNMYNMPSGFEGEFVTSLSLKDMCETLFGYLTESKNLGLISALADTYEVNAIETLLIKGDLDVLRNTCASGGASAATLEELDEFIAEVNSAYNDCIEWVTELRTLDSEL